MKVSLMKKGSQALALTLLSVCLSVGSTGLASAHSTASHTSLKDSPKVYVNPGTVKETTNGTGGFILYGHHLAPWTTYTLASADLGNPNFCPATGLGTVTTDLAGNFQQSLIVGITAATITTNSTATATYTFGAGFTTVTITIPNPFGGGPVAITIPTTVGTHIVSIPNPFGGVGNVPATVVVTGSFPYTNTITIPNPAGGGGTIVTTFSGPPTAPATITDNVFIPAMPCIPNTYHISVQSPTHQLYNASVKIKA